MSMNVGKSSLLLGVLLSIGVSAEETSKSAQVNKEEVSNRIFDIWYEGKNANDKCEILDGDIEKYEQEGQIYLKTVIRYEDMDDFFPEEKEDFPAFILRKNSEAMRVRKVGQHASFLDGRTRCVNLVRNNNDDVVFVKCKTRFTKEEFAKKLQKKITNKQSNI